MGVDDKSSHDNNRRKFLTTTASILGGIGAGFASVPFIKACTPSLKTKSIGGPVDIDISKIKPGEKITAAWRGQPIFIVNRTDASLKQLENPSSNLVDPESKQSIQPQCVQNNFRSIKKNYLVVVGMCTHLGCVPSFKADNGGLDPDTSWKGGFFCPCHGSKFDLSGRVYKNAPAPTNLSIPPHHYVNNKILRIGENAPQKS